MIVVKEESAVPIRLWVSQHDDGSPDLEQKALDQLKNISTLPFIHPHGVCAMPDVHLGIGATVGSVIATEKVIIPAAVGVDIGCGMMAVRTSLKAHDLPDSLTYLRHTIERDVPLGAGGYHSPNAPDLKYLITAMPSVHPQYTDLWEDITGKNMESAARQLGTLGSGNHFIEICLDEDERVWIMLHTGSRGIGNKIGTYFIAAAKRDMERWFVTLPDKDLAYFPEGSENYQAYIYMVKWAQVFAKANRSAMMRAVLRCIREEIPKLVEIDEFAIDCHHNYVEHEHHFGRNVLVTRKGAIRARAGDLGIIPGSMGARSFIVEGLGNEESYHSCSHGAGRKMSRNQARATFTIDDLANQTEGVECRKDKSVLDEIPGAYKDIDTVMANQKDLVKIRHTLRQVLNVKGG